MKSNLGTIDRSIRLVIAAILIILYFVHVLSGTLGIILLILSGIFIVTGILGFCPLYLPFKLSTGRKS
jgi:hypothetical protein